MSAIMKLHNTDMPDKVFVCYDFKQIRDAVLVVMFTEKQKRYEIQKFHTVIYYLQNN